MYLCYAAFEQNFLMQNVITLFV